MKKFSILLISTVLLLLLALGLSSCGSRLSAPSGINLEIETQTLKWNAVKGARFYTVSISGQEREISTSVPSVSLEFLDPGVYQIKIKANGDGKTVDDSNWSETEFERFAESGLKYQLINNGSEYELIGPGTASGDVVMEAVFREKPVTSIAEKALHSNSKITGFTVGENVKTIGEKAFSKCSNLTSVVIRSNVESIGDYAFQSCKALEKVIIPDSITSIAPHTFAWCSSLTEVIVGKNLTSIGEYAFSNCAALKKITYDGIDTDLDCVHLPDTVEHIAQYAFSECKSLTDIKLGGVKRIDACAFAECSLLNSIDFGTKLTDIGDTAFRNCTSLSSIDLPDSVLTLGNGSFLGCTQMMEASIGSGLVKVGYSAFSNTALVTDTSDSILVLDGWLLQIIDTSIEKLVLPNDVYGVAAYATSGCEKLAQVSLPGVKYICEAAFSELKALTTVTVGESLQTIADYAFYACPYLDNVSIGGMLKTIGNYAFYECKRLKTLTLPDTVTSIGTRAFRHSGAYEAVANSANKFGTVYIGNWVVDFVAPPSPQMLATVKMTEGTRGVANYAFSSQMLLSVSMPDTVEYIGKGAFYNVSAYVIELSQGIKIIEDYAFYGCMYTYNFGHKDDYTLAIPEGVQSIGRSAFYDCQSLVSVSVPESVKTIGPYAFYGCINIGLTLKFEKPTGENDAEGNPITKVEELVGGISLAEGVEVIGDKAFQKCNELTKIVIPNSVTSLGEKVFYKCPKLNSVTIGTGLAEIPAHTFYKCEALETVVISGDLKLIGDYSFRGCTALKNVDLGGTENIGRYAFYGCSSLTEMLIPDSVASIGDYAFRGCNGLKAIMLPNSVKTIGRHTFYSLNETTLYLESSTSLPGWNEKANSSFRPEIYGCSFSDDGSYVVSITVAEGSIANKEARNGISDPTRAGYVFGGWTTEKDGSTVIYTSETVSNAEAGSVLYAIWTEQPDSGAQDQ